MHPNKFLIYFIVVIFVLGFVHAATISGVIYDLSLKKMNNARVEINTVPKQLMIAQNGTYSFNVPNGFYIIKAQLFQKTTLTASVEENITITQDGFYVLDLILFPEIEEGIENIDIEANDVVKENNYLVWIIIILLLIALIAGYYFVKAKRKKATTNSEKSKIEESQDDELDTLIRIIKKEDGRTTQKEIRKQMPLSEAKISLMIAELEHKGVIEKIKKGRGNIIILKK